MWETIHRVHYTDVTMSPMASQITSLGIVYSTVYTGSDQRKHQSSASLAFVWRIHRRLVNSPHKRPVTWKMFSFDYVIMITALQCNTTIKRSITEPCTYFTVYTVVVILTYHILTCIVEQNNINTMMLQEMPRLPLFIYFATIHFSGKKCH